MERWPAIYCFYWQVRYFIILERQRSASKKVYDHCLRL